MSATQAAVQAFDRLVGLRAIVDVAMCPTGDRLAFLVDGDVESVRLHDVDGGTRDMKLGSGFTATSVTWSGDGTSLLVTAGTSPGYPDRLIVVDPDGGTSDRVVRVAGAIEDVVASGSVVVLRVADPGSERDGMHLGLRVPVPDTASPLPTTPMRRLLWLDLADASSPLPVTLSGYSVWDHDADATGHVLAVVSRDPRPAGYYQAALVLTDIEGRDLRVLVSGRGQLARPRLSGDGRAAYVVEGRSIVSGRVLRIDLADGTVREVPDLDDVTDLGVLDDGSLWFCGWQGTGTQVGTLDSELRLTSRVVRRGALGGRDGQPALSVAASGRFAAIADDPELPSEVFVGSLGDKGEWARVTHLNEEMRGLTSALSRELVTWTSADGTPVEGLLLRRTGAPAPQPLVVLLHGGPTWLWANSFAPAESNALAVPLALAGAAVLLPNPRGSSGRGQGYADAVAGHVGEIDVSDVLAGVAALVSAGMADPDRMATLGLSYGGFLSAWLVASTDLFRGAVVMSGVSDWTTFVTTSNLGGGFDTVYFPGIDPQTEAGHCALAAVSPARHGRTGMAPTLVLHGAEDQVTPLGQAQQLTESWTAAGSVVELVVYPREGHELVEPEHRRDATRRVLDWLHRYGVLG